MKQAATDQELQRMVIDELDWTPDICSTAIAVAVCDGAVVLSGSVGSYPERRLAEDAALRVHGVNVVAEKLLVSTPNAPRADLDLAAAARESLSLNMDVQSRTVHSTVIDRVLTLTGHVGWPFQKAAADRAVRYLPGLVDVVNKLEVGPDALAQEVHDLINEALVQNPALDSRHITVTASEGAILLEGNVQSWAERRQADNAAWTASGVVSVRNRLLVSS